MRPDEKFIAKETNDNDNETIMLQYISIMNEICIWVFSHNSDRRSKLETPYPKQLHSSTWSNKIALRLKSLLQTLNSCKFNLWGLFFFLGKKFWIGNSMLTLSFIHNFARPKKLSRKRWTDEQKHSQEYYPVHLLPGTNIFKQRSTPHRKPCVQKSST